MMIDILALLCIKHFIVDALLQTPYQYLNKGKFLHLGGLLHTGLHGLGTAICFINESIEMIIMLSFIDFCLHYTIDYVKINITKAYHWSEYKKDHLRIYSNNFFIALVLDQCLHFLTYILLVSLI